MLKACLIGHVVLIQRFLVVCIFLLLARFTYANDVWRFTSLNWEPYVSEYAVDQGKTIRKLRELLSTADISLEVEFYPWRRAQFLAKNDDRYLGYLVAWPEEVREGFIASNAVDWSSIDVLIKAESDLEYSTVDDLFRYHAVGIVSTYVYPQLIVDAMTKYSKNTIKGMDEESLALMLQQGRIQAAVTDANVMRVTANQKQVTGIKTIKNVMKKELVVAFKNTPENHRRLELLNRLLMTD